ncbi:MAG: type I-E CRISPR-associated protein Cas6/Cse3/CasE [Magnetococcales bacterium]|nr:type I-E CRISPR-associated protein Cas6/Cse3/CasE [Magnetococcales bacterium]
MTNPFSMIKIVVPARVLFRHFKGREGASNDDGYRIHGLLSGLFGDSAPKPFNYHIQGRQVVVGYTDVDDRGLMDLAKTYAEPDVLAVLADNLHGKPMPVFPQGQRLGFRVNVIPILRSNGGFYKKGAEVDAWLMARERVPEGESVPDRQWVYLDWLRQALARQGGAEVEHAAITAMRGVTLRRRNDQRDFVRINQREVVFQGTVRVINSEAFYRLMRRGIGRHRAFGFGMVLLTPPQSRSV